MAPECVFEKPLFGCRDVPVARLRRPTGASLRRQANILTHAPRHSEGLHLRNRIVIGTRASALAMAQAQWVMSELSAAAPEVQIELRKITTKGDTITDVPLARIEGKGVFTKELELALLDGRADLAVHSMKDLPTEQAAGLAVACVPEREDAHDVLVARDDCRSVGQLPRGAVIGTSSLRRAAQLLAARPDLHVQDIRGNVDTRLRKLAAGSLAAIVLARAGLNRLGAAHSFLASNIPFEVMLPAAGQGALAIETRDDDAELRTLLVESLHDQGTFVTTSAERRLLLLVGGGCHIPLGAHARLEDGRLKLEAALCSTDGTRVLKASVSAAHDDWERAGRMAFENLLRDGAEEIIREANEK